jgi:hypothetical protein
MRVILAFAMVCIAGPAWAQTAATGTGTAGTGVPSTVVAPPAEDLVPRTSGNIVAPPAENLVPRTSGNIVAPPAENLVNGAGGGAPATGVNTLGTSTGLTQPPAVTIQPLAGQAPTAFYGGAQGAPGNLGSAGGGMAAAGVLAPTGTSPGSRPGAPTYVVAPLDPYDPDEPDALDFSRTP